MCIGETMAKKLDNEINLAVDTLFQMNLDSLIYPNIGPATNDENPSGPDAAARGVGKCDITVHRIVDWCEAVAVRIDGWIVRDARSNAVGDFEDVTTFDVRGGTIGETSTGSSI